MKEVEVKEELAIATADVVFKPSTFRACPIGPRRLAAATARRRLPPLYLCYHPADDIATPLPLESPLHTDSSVVHRPPSRDDPASMSLLRSTRLITTPRSRLQIIPNIAARPQHRQLSSTSVRSAGDHAHEDHYDPPGGWLFGVKPGEKYENEGWENVWVYGFFGSMLFGVVGWCYKPDTRYVCFVDRNSLITVSLY